MKATTIKSIIEAINAISATGVYEDDNVIEVGYRAKKNSSAVINKKTGEIEIVGKIAIQATIERIVEEAIEAEKNAEQAVSVEPKIEKYEILNSARNCNDSSIEEVAEREGMTFVEEIPGYPRAIALQDDLNFYIDFRHDSGFEEYPKADFSLESAIRHHNDSFCN